MGAGSIEAFFRTQFEPLQYAAFFGALAIFGLVEALIPLGAGAPRRSGRWPANFMLTVLNVAVLSLLPVSGLLAADYSAAHDWGIFNWIGISGWAAVCVGMIARSLVSYGIHVAMHKFPLLWKVHQVHHCDNFVDVSTTVRFHPLELIISMPILFASIVVLGISPLVIILYELFDAATAVWTHSNMKLPRGIDRVLAFVFVTPAMHRIHHSSFQPETDSNYGATLSIWDRLFGTYRAKDQPSLASMQRGLRSVQDQRNRSFVWLLGMPFRGRLAPMPSGGQSSAPMQGNISVHGSSTG